jgi:two-component system response regulator (stage 0 sporulation protein A)
MENQAEKSLEELLFDMMVNMGVPAHLKGYHYLKAAVMLVSEDMRAVGSVTKLLYPEIAKRYNTTDGKVERAIRNAIEVSWMRGNQGMLKELFGYSYESGKLRPTNSEYIARIADKMRMDIKHK